MPLDPAIRSLIAQFRKSPNWDNQLDLELLQRFWPDLVGEQLAAVTQVTAIHGSRIVMTVPDKIWRTQLREPGMKNQLLQKINEPWGIRKITEIAFTNEN